MSIATTAATRSLTKHFEELAMYPAKMAALVFGHVVFLSVFIWVFH
jgi:hypothetical protein